MGPGVLSAILLLFLTVYAEDCSLDQFRCEDGACISRDQQCDGHKNCEKGEDEQLCTFLSVCDVEELQCNQAGTSSVKCYNPVTDICKVGGYNAVCEDKQDVKQCGCAKNDETATSRPMRCPVDGTCQDIGYNLNGNQVLDMADYCDKCKDTVTCGADLTWDASLPINKYYKCEIDGDHAGLYFQCEQSDGTKSCLPVEARCDSVLSCTNDSPADCKAPVVTVTVSPTATYIGGDVTWSYTVTGYPKPMVQLYHYNKKVDMNNIDFEGTTLKSSYSRVKKGEYIFKVDITAVSEMFYGTYTLVASNVVNTAVDDDQSNSFHRRVLGEEVKVALLGAPELSITHSGVVGPLTGDVDYTWVVEEDPFTVTCDVTAFPAPPYNITFMLEDSVLMNGTNWYISASAYSETDKSLTSTLTFHKPDYQQMEGEVSCVASNILGSDTSFSVSLSLVLPPAITSHAEDEVQLIKLNSPFTLDITAQGFPNPYLYLYESSQQDSDYSKVDGFHPVKTDVTVQGQHTIEAVTETTFLKMEAVLLRGEADAAFQVVAVYPISDPTIEGDASFSLPKGPQTQEIKHVVKFDSDLTDRDPDLIVVTVTMEDGAEVDPGVWTVAVTVGGTDSEQVEREVTLTSVADVALQNIGRFKLSAEDGVSGTVALDFTVDVSLPLSFVTDITEEEVEESTTLSLLLSVEVEFKTFTEADNDALTVVWNYNGSPITQDTDRVTTESTFDSATYIYTLTFTLEDLTISDTGTYSVIVSHSNQMVDDSVVVTVLDDPCVSNPCENSATCTKKTATEYTCTCVHETFYTGSRCENNVACTEGINPCSEGSTCEPTSPTSDLLHYTCTCVFGIEGRNCTDQIPFCEREGDAACGTGLCRNTWVEDGTAPEGYECFCKLGDGGSFCDIAQLCTPNPCLHGGVCTVSGTGDDREQGCECEEGWQGEDCGERTPGHCKVDCNGRAYCEDENVCSCDYPYYGDTCLEVIPDTARVSVESYLSVTANPAIPEERVQVVKLPLRVMEADTSCLIASISSEDGADFVKFSVSTAASDVVEVSVSAELGPNTYTEVFSGVQPDRVSRLSLLLKEGQLVAAVGLVGGTVRSHTFSVPDTYEQKMLKQFQISAVQGGCKVNLSDHITIGPWSYNPAKDFSEGRSVTPLPPCTYHNCENGGVCEGNEELYTQQCNCDDTGYEGEHCETRVDLTCELGCLNGGRCWDGYCICELHYRGVLCEQYQSVGPSLTMSGPNSVVHYRDEAITSVTVTWSTFTNIADTILVIGSQYNSIELLEHRGELYMIVVRGREKGAYSGIGATDSVLQDGSFCITISLSGDDIHVQVADDDDDDDADVVVFLGTDLPCNDGMGPLATLTVYGMEGLVSDVTVEINGETANPSSGSGLVNSQTTDVCEGECYDGSCSNHGNSITCHECPESNPVTCSSLMCDPSLCEGDCSDIGECVCPFGKGGNLCDTEITFTPYSIPMTTSTYGSYLQYDTEPIMGQTAQIQFNVKPAGAGQRGVLAYAGTEDQYIMIRLEEGVVEAVVQCHPGSLYRISVTGVTYAQWNSVFFSWTEVYLSLSVADAIQQVQVEGCLFQINNTLYLGGAPDNMGASVRAAFAPSDFMLPLNSRLVGGRSVGVDDSLEICDTDFHPCSKQGTESCDQEEDDTITCQCKAGFKGTFCEDIVQPCDGVVCSLNEECVPDLGVCICSFPYGRTGPVDATVCEETVDQINGFCMENSHSYAVIVADLAKTINNFEGVFKFLMEEEAEVGVYNLVSLVYPGEAGTEAFSLTLNVSMHDNEQDKVYKIIQGYLSVETVIDEPIGPWHTLRIKTSQSGTELELDGEVLAALGGGVPIVQQLHFGRLDDPSLNACFADVFINEDHMTNLAAGAGVKSCEEKVPTTYENRMNEIVWAELGLL